MAAAVVDLDINEGETFVMAAEFWEDEDNTIPIDISLWVWSGAFSIGTKYIPMLIVKHSTAINAIGITVKYSDMKELSSQGKYDIDALIENENFRMFQGDVTVSQEVTV